MSIKDPEKATVRLADAAEPAEAHQTGTIPIASPERHRANPPRSSVSVAGNRLTASSEPLLSPRDILTRLNMASADPAKWMRRTFMKYGVPYVHACGKMRATEAQYLLLLEKITCSPSAAGGKTASNVSEIQSRSVTSASTSKNSIQERVKQMLHRT